MVMGLLTDCTSAPKAFDPNISGPQIMVEPDALRLGVARVMGTDISIRGKGFEPEDSVFITMMGIKQNGKSVDIPIFAADVDKSGDFAVKTTPGFDPVGLTFKIGILLRAKTGTNEKGKTILIVSQPPIPAGEYTLKAVSMESDKTATCRLVLKDPSAWDRFKDWMGRQMGKIRKE
jgi:hypothetical protein